MKKSLICIPTFNERENILPLINKIFSVVNHVHILVIDDNSPDQTAQLVIDQCPEYSKKVFLLKRLDEKGLGRAYIDGFQWGIRENYHYIIQCDADFSHNPEYLPHFFNKLEEGFDLVIGSRNIPGGGVRNWSYLRRFLSRFGSFYGRTLLRLPIRDLTGGFNAYRREVLKSLDLSKIRSNGYVFQIELKFKTYLLGFRITETPIIFSDRIRGESKMNLKIVLEAFWHVIYLQISRLTAKPTKP